MAEIGFSERAKNQIDEIYAYGLKTFGQAQSRSYIENLYHQFELLAAFPGMGLELSVRGRAFRRFACGVHIIMYSVHENQVIIEALFDGRSDHQRLI